MQTAVTDNKATPLNIRIRTEQRHLIEQAAESLEKTVSDFVRDAALREANHALLNKSAFKLSAENWVKFNEALDCPPAENPRLHDLLTRQPVWDK